MSINPESRKIRAGSCLTLAALCLCASAAIAQPLTGPFAPPRGFPGGGPPRGAMVPTPLPANAPQPSADPRNFDGTWYHTTTLMWQLQTDMFGHPTPITEAGRKIAERRLQSNVDGRPYLNAAATCRPPGQPWQMELNMPFQVLQSKNQLEFLFEEFHGFWNISLNGAEAAPSGYMGRSIGHWDGNTLVVETSGFKEPVWLDLDGTPASKDAKITERIRKVKSDHWYLEVEFTVDDPTYYTSPWSFIRDFDWRPDMTLFREYNCELDTGSKDGGDPGLIPEPQE
jgi:hypothetical protein